MKLPQRQVADPRAQENFDALAPRIPTGVTALPANPADGQEVHYVADATNGVVWHLRYRAASTSAYKWEFVGGPPMYANVDAEETTGLTTYVALATAGPSITVPFAGDYLVEVGFVGYNSAIGSVGIMSFDVGATVAVDADSARIAPAIAGAFGQEQGFSKRRKTSVAAGAAIAAKYRVTGGTGTFGARLMAVLPIRVG